MTSEGLYTSIGDSENISDQTKTERQKIWHFALDGSGKTLLDHTTVVVTSEFSRDPVKNELGGKHHWPANSMIIIGKGTPRRKNNLPTVFGECDEGLNPIKRNPRNGSTRSGVEDLEMNHGIATILAMAGLDPVTLIGQEPITALMGSG